MTEQERVAIAGSRNEGSEAPMGTERRDAHNNAMSAARGFMNEAAADEHRDARNAQTNAVWAQNNTTSDFWKPGWQDIVQRSQNAAVMQANAAEAQKAQMGARVFESLNALDMKDKEGRFKKQQISDAAMATAVSLTRRDGWMPPAILDDVSKMVGFDVAGGKMVNGNFVLFTRDAKGKMQIKAIANKKQQYAIMDRANVAVDERRKLWGELSSESSPEVLASEGIRSPERQNVVGSHTISGSAARQLFGMNTGAQRMTISAFGANGNGGFTDYYSGPETGYGLVSEDSGTRAQSNEQKLANPESYKVRQRDGEGNVEYEGPGGQLYYKHPDEPEPWEKYGKKQVGNGNGSDRLEQERIRQEGMNLRNKETNETRRDIEGAKITSKEGMQDKDLKFKYDKARKDYGVRMLKAKNDTEKLEIAREWNSTRKELGLAEIDVKQAMSELGWAKLDAEIDDNKEKRKNELLAEQNKFKLGMEKAKTDAERAETDKKYKDWLAKNGDELTKLGIKKAEEAERHNKAGEAQDAAEEEGRNKRSAESNATRKEVAEISAESKDYATSEKSSAEKNKFKLGMEKAKTDAERAETDKKYKDWLAKNGDELTKLGIKKAEEAERHNKAGEAQDAAEEEGRNKRSAESNATRKEVAEISAESKDYATSEKSSAEKAKVEVKRRADFEKAKDKFWDDTEFDDHWNVRPMEERKKMLDDWIEENYPEYGKNGDTQDLVDVSESGRNLSPKEIAELRKKGIKWDKRSNRFYHDKGGK